MPEKKFSFESSVKRIEEIVNALEKGDVELEKSLELFQEGAGLIKSCSKALDDAEQKLQLLVKDDEGPKFEKFETGDNL